mgnify:CR=1 FL=1|tara:strand:- start:619 stop:732 length:114 start_codon:yes stop_codon:yes gene_type:complete
MCEATNSHAQTGTQTEQVEGKRFEVVNGRVETEYSFC